MVLSVASSNLSSALSQSKRVQMEAKSYSLSPQSLPLKSKSLKGTHVLLPGLALPPPPPLSSFSALNTSILAHVFLFLDNCELPSLHGPHPTFFTLQPASFIVLDLPTTWDAVSPFACFSPLMQHPVTRTVGKHGEQCLAHKRLSVNTCTPRMDTCEKYLKDLNRNEPKPHQHFKH